MRITSSIYRPPLTDLDRRGSAGQGHERAGRLVAHGRARRVQQVVDAANEARPLGRVGMADFVDELDDHQLQDVAERVHLINTAAQVVQSALL